MKQRLSFGAVIAAILLVAALLAPLTYGPATAAPAAVTTPVAAVHSGVRSSVATFWQTQVITADGCSPLINVADHAKIDLQWVIDHGTTNTTTFDIRWTNTGNASQVVTEQTVLTNSAADAVGGGQFFLYGRQACIYANVTNTNPLTVTFVGVAK